MSKTPKEISRELSDMVNTMGFDYKAVSEAMLNEHRTLQQNFTKLCLSWLYTIGDTDRFDLRNEASVKAGKAVKNALGEYGQHLPHI